MREPTHTDETLLLSGDPEDFGRFYDRYVRSLLGYFQRRTRDPEAAADLTAETFAAALAARGRFQARAVPASVWLFAIAQHKRRTSTAAAPRRTGCGAGSASPACRSGPTTPR
jgi:DNA-directed RNA polymerase specialized sigma24 family protein